MNTEQARALVKETFPQTFDKGRFRNFVINLLNHIDESKSQMWNTTCIKDAFKGHVKGYERLGTYTSPEEDKLDVLIVHLTKESKLERARTAIRNFVADHLKSLDGKDAALVAFVSPTEKQWRFSYVKMEYAAVEKEDGKVGVQTTLTPARRSSYIVGEGESCHTAQTRFLDLLQDTENHPTLANIEDAFSVEAVTREFFEQYKSLFLDLKDDLDTLAKKDKTVRDEFAAKNISTADFAKKLMGQIVFLYFLQKKGWLGVPKGGDWGDGAHNFLRQLFDGKFVGYKNFFNDILERLFYDTLATDRGHEALCKIFNCRIPFLNGGLFEPLCDYDWQKTDIIIPNSLFSNTKTTSAGDKGTGILDVFDRYNFTVNEAEPLEKEVAIDPEMLGKVFENLLEVKERKSKGSFYTPREIVQYMCQESLINYLDTAISTAEESVTTPKPQQIKLFGKPELKQTNLTTMVRRDIIPRGDIEVFIHSGEQISHYEAVDAKYSIKMPATIEKHAPLIDEKLAAITVCDPAIGSGAFPVGMMQEIVRARSALTPYFEDVSDRTPYHFKRHAIQDCLYGVDIDPGAVEIAKLRLWLSLVVDEDDVKQIKPLPNLDYKIVVGNSLVGFPDNWASPVALEIESLQHCYFDEVNLTKKKELKKQIDGKINARYQSSLKVFGYEVTFDFKTVFSEVFHKNKGFDVVIANPPYVRQEAIKEFKPTLKKVGYECFTGTADLYVYFYERGVRLLRPAGTLAYISSNSFLNSGFGERLRRYLSANTRIRLLIDFAETKVFEAVTEPCVICLTRDTEADHEARFLKWDQSTPPERIKDAFETGSQAIFQHELKSSGWLLESPAVLRLLDKMRSTGKPLGEYGNRKLYRGIITGLNEAFVVDRATRDCLIREHKSSGKILKPLLHGRDLKHWRAEFGEQYLITIESSENKGHPWSGKSEKEAERIFAATYPAVYARFEGFRPALRKRDDQGKYFWELRSCAYWREFEEPKIIYQDIARYFGMVWDDTGALLVNTCYFVPRAEKWMLAVLRSSTMQFYVRKVIGSDEGGFIRLFTIHVENFPVPTVTPAQQKPVERLVERILSAKQRDAGADVSALEREIDELVYALYCLTPAEIKLVEGATK